VAALAPDWLPTVIDIAGWGRRYGARVDTWRLPTSKTKRAELVAAYGTDAVTLLRAVYGTGAPHWLRELPAVDVLRRVLLQNYVITRDAAGREVIRMREADTDGLPPASTRLTSPYDLDTRWAAKGDDLYWNGYKVHVSETCDLPEPAPGDGDPGDGDPPSDGERPGDGERPNIITGVATTAATVPDAAMTEKIHTMLAGRELLPGEHLLDSGYPSAALMVDSLRRWGVTLVTPLLADVSRQARAGDGYDRAGFTIDFDTRHATCPQGQISSRWNPFTQRGTDVIVIKFPARACRGCPVRDQCTRSTSPKYGRQLTVPPREVHEAQLAARATQNTPHWQARYARRAGVEATIGQGVAVTGMRRARYRGLPKTQLEHVYSATALNLIRLHAYWHGHALDRGRTSHLTRLELTLAA
jgi:Transposase DDE domain